jgi:hypothetical protein
MKAPDLIQSRMWHKLELTLEPDGVVVHDKSPGRSQKTHIYFENIPPKAQEITVTSKKLFSAAIIFTVLAMVCIPVAFAGKEKDDGLVPIIWGGIAAIIWFFAILSRKSLVVYAQNNARLVFFKNIPSTEAVDGFVRKLFVFRNSHLLKKYGRFSEEENFENKISRLNYLRAQEVISEDVFESKRVEFLKGNKKSPGPLGFAQQ